MCKPRFVGCPVTCQNYRNVIDYRQERERQETLAIEASLGYATELAEYVSTYPLITFKQWLTGKAYR